MDIKIKTSRDQFNHFKKDSYLNHLFFDSSVILESTREAVSSSKSDAFIVDWQMNNPKQDDNNING